MLPNWGENEKCVLWMKFPSNQQFLSFSSFCFFVFFPFLLFLVLVLISCLFLLFVFISSIFIGFFFFYSSILDPLACALFFLSFKFEVSIPKFLSKACVTFCFRNIIINSFKLHFLFFHFSSQPNK